MEKNLQRFWDGAAGKKSVRPLVAGICAAALAGAAAGFCLAVKLEKHKREIGSECRPAVPNGGGAADGAPDEAVKPEK